MCFVKLHYVKYILVYRLQINKRNSKSWKRWAARGEGMGGEGREGGYVIRIASRLEKDELRWGRGGGAGRWRWSSVSELVRTSERNPWSSSVVFITFAGFSSSKYCVVTESFLSFSTATTCSTAGCTGYERNIFSIHVYKKIKNKK